MEKHRGVEGEEAMDTNTGSGPGYQSQSQYPGNSPSGEVRGHWDQRAVDPGIETKQFVPFLAGMHPCCFHIFMCSAFRFYGIFTAFLFPV